MAKATKPSPTTLLYGKIPPQALDLEEAVLGAIMLEKDTLQQVQEIIHTEDIFYNEIHQKIYAAILRLSVTGHPVDLLTITQELRKTNELEAVGGPYHLTRLTMAVLSSAHAQTHSRILVEKYLQRQLISISAATLADAYQDSIDIFQLLGRQETQLYQLTAKNIRNDFQGADKIMQTLLKEDEEALRDVRNKITGIPTGNTDLDHITGGLKKGRIYIIAARPSVGKTAWAMSVTHHAAITSGIPVGIFSLEMEKTDLLRILISIHNKIDTFAVNEPHTRTPQQNQQIQATASTIATQKIQIDDTPSLTIFELKAKIRRMITKYKVRLVIIDYLQLMEGDENRSSNRENEVAKISREIKKIAKEYQVPIIVLCQINRDFEKRASNTFKLSDLRESGAIEQDADFVAFLWRPDEEDLKNDPTLAGTGRLDILKHRRGIKKRILYQADMSIQTWGDYQPFGHTPPPQPPPDDPRAGIHRALPPPAPFVPGNFQTINPQTQNPSTHENPPW